MQPSRDSSLLKSLAVAFGDGLAFGVGMKLTQSAAAARQPVNRIERSPAAGFDQKALDAVVHALELRLQEQAGHLDRRLADVEASIAVDLKTLNEQDQVLAKRTEEHLNALRAEIVAMQREFAEAVGRIVGEHIESQMAGRFAKVEDELRKGQSDVASLRLDVSEMIGNALRHQVPTAVNTAVDAAVPGAVKQQLAPMLTFVNAMAQACTDLAAKIAEPAEPVQAAAPPPAAPEPPRSTEPVMMPSEPSSPPADSDPQSPQFAQLKRSSDLWRIPLVSSFVFAAGAMLLSHYL